jgi:hypothetical protein
MLLDGEVAIFAAGQTSFTLQGLYHPKWSEHAMMQLMVDDLDQWWSHIESLDRPKRFGVAAPRPPAMMPGVCESPTLSTRREFSGTSPSAGQTTLRISYGSPIDDWRRLGDSCAPPHVHYHVLLNSAPAST